MAPARPRLGCWCIQVPQGSHPRKSCPASAVARSSRPAPSPATHCVTQAVLGRIAKVLGSMEGTSHPGACPAVKSTTSCGYVHTTEPISCVWTRTGFAAKGVASLAFVLKWIFVFPIHRGSRRRVRRGSTHLTRFLHSSFQLSRG